MASLRSKTEELFYNLIDSRLFLRPLYERAMNNEDGQGEQPYRYPAPPDPGSCKRHLQFDDEGPSTSAKLQGTPRSKLQGTPRITSTPLIPWRLPEDESINGLNDNRSVNGGQMPRLEWVQGDQPRNGRNYGDENDAETAERALKSPVEAFLSQIGFFCIKVWHNVTGFLCCVPLIVLLLALCLAAFVFQPKDTIHHTYEDEALNHTNVINQVPVTPTPRTTITTSVVQEETVADDEEEQASTPEATEMPEHSEEPSVITKAEASLKGVARDAIREMTRFVTEDESQADPAAEDLPEPSSSEGKHASSSPSVIPTEERRISNLETLVEDLQSQLTERDERISMLEAHSKEAAPNDKVDSEIEELKKMVLGTKQALDQHEKETTALKKRNSELTEALEAQKTRVEAMNEEVDELRKKDGSPQVQEGGNSGEDAVNGLLAGPAFQDKVEQTVQNRLDEKIKGRPNYILGAKGHSGEYSYGSVSMGTVRWLLGLYDNRAEITLSPVNSPGDCWPFATDQGWIEYTLQTRILVDEVALFHLHHTKRTVLHRGTVPKEFKVEASPDNGASWLNLGTYVYKEYGNALQTFPVEQMSEAVDRVRFTFLSNYGNDKYTCLYEAEVYGVPPPPTHTDSPEADETPTEE